MNKWFGAAVFAAAALCVPSFGATVFHVSVDTSSLPPGTQADLDLQWSAGIPLGQPGTATITKFVNTGGSFVADPFVSGDITGVLLATTRFTVANNGDIDLYFHTMQFGSRLDFDLSLANTLANTTFSLDIFDSVAGRYLLTGDPAGASSFDWALLRIESTEDGSLALITPPGPDGGPSVVTVAAVPESPVWLMLLAGFGVAGLMLRSRPKAATA